MHYKKLAKIHANSLGVLIGILVFLIPVFLYYWAYSKENYYENLHKFSGIHSDARNVSYFQSLKKGKLIYECDLPLESFFDLARKEKWAIKEIVEQPIKMIRYRYAITSPEIFDKERKELSQETETKNSCFHFVKQGYFYIEDTKRPFIHVAYDTIYNKMYVFKDFDKEEFTRDFICGEASTEQQSSEQ